ncbi:hypothetical protein [Desulfomonile tiedjei]|uniref:DUF3137 domain-containing protein n=1 Tax=Desulfomonile tiedjei (strain ATCC 49306 / DSM 6799 / DCB-1) TaxID=706587 RepID=I4CCV6_DESTA|nr:hypothetical protein [Desulfomonile tiedjei]AFM27397.1 hypothetical protein Desti_4778 [Desulfomonile tiedjei DSM 6799]
METNGSTGVFFGIVLIALFAISFLAGDIAGIIIERHSARKWRIAAEKMGFEFDGRKRKAHSLSEIFLPKLLFPEAQETAFSFCQIMKSLSGRSQRFNISINDLTVWDYHTRGPIIYRSVVCMIKGYDFEIIGPIGLVRIGSILSYGFGQDKTLKEYTLSEEDDFSTTYRVFGRGGSSLSIFTQDLRRFCMEHRRAIDCLLINAEEMILVWTSDSPEYFPHLVDLAMGIVSRVLGPAQQIN